MCVLDFEDDKNTSYDPFAIMFAIQSTTDSCLANLGDVPKNIDVPDVEGSDSTTGTFTSVVSSQKSHYAPKHGMDSVESSTSTDSLDDPVCVVGLACHLPGDVRSLASLWELLVNKRSVQGPVPPERFNIKGFHGPDDSRAGIMSADGGYFLKEDVRLFENSFFGINNLEALYMDPLQRKLLEAVFECFENAGVSLEHMAGSNTGVYTGDFTCDYQIMHYRDPDYLHRYSATGSGKAIMANRISNIFNLQGPSLTMNTACSSALYCLHTAVSAIKAGDCDGAIVAAANLIMSPEQHIEIMKGGVLSPTSTCHTFDISADGYGRGEGVEAVYIKRLSSALKDNDKVWGVIRATSLNACGKTPGISQPSAALQEAVIRKAYANAALDFCDTDYVECHGTGTAVGDVIEVEALKQCFSPRESPLMIGSVKTNLGHSESTSGLTSLLKVLLAFENGRIPPTFGVSKLNPKLPLESSNFKVVTEAEQWPRSLRRASINSFGYGGANAHVIVEALDSYLGSDAVRPLPIPKCNDQLLVLPVSAVSSRSLQTRIDQVVALVGCSDATYLRNLTFTLTDRRSHLRSKASLLVRASDDGGSEVIETQLFEPPKLNPSGSLPFAFVFTGQGAQYACMAKELLLHNTIFSATIQELDNVLQVLPSEHRPAWTLRQAILDPPGVSRVGDVTYSQPLCTAVQIGLVKVLKSWGVCASAVVGHSSGEIAAAYAAGLLGQSEAIIVAYMRGYSVAQLKAHGSMAAAGIDVQSAEQIIDKRGLKRDVCVACVNSPTSVTLSGSLRGIEAILSELQNQKKFCRKLETGGRAYHSHMMREIGSYYETLITPYVNGKWDKLANSDTQMYSSVGYSGDNPSILNLGTNNARYWRDNLETPVQFNSALLNLAASGDFYFIEIGPHHALKGPVQQTLATVSGPNKRSLPYSPSLIRNEDSNIALKRLAGSLFSHGYELNWGNINNLPRSIALRPLPDLPPYPWDYSAGLLWHEPRASTELRNRKYVRHELLGSQQLAGNGIDWSWRNILRLNEVPWLRDHKVESQVIFPASGYLAMAIEAISQILGLKDRSPHDKPVSFEIRNVNIRTAFVVQSEDGLDADANQVELHTTVSPRKISMTTASANWYDFSISSWTSGHTTVHCAGNIRANGSVEPKSTVPVSNSIDHNIPMKRWYKRFEEEGLRYGPQFRSLVKLCTDGTKNRPDAVSTVRLVPPATHTSYTEYGMHPITIDACFQTAIFGITGGKPSSLRAYLPVSISECWIQAVQVKTPQSEAHIYTRTARTSIATQKADCTLRVAGDSLINLRGVRLSLYTGKMDSSHSGETVTQRNPYLRVHWKPDILRLHPGVEDRFREYVKGRVKRIHTDVADDKTLAIGVLLELAGHKSPGMRVLELGRCCDAKAKIWLDLLNSDKAFPRCGTWQAGTLLKDGEVAIEDGDEGPFDVVLVLDYAASERCFGGDSKKNALSMIADHGIIISHKTDRALGSLSAANFATLHVGDEIVLATHTAKIPSLQGIRDVVIIFQELTPHVEELISSIKSTLKMATGVAQVSHVSLSEVHTVKIHEKTICISLLEFETEFLATMNQDEMDLLRSVTNVVTDLLWVTGGDMLSLTGQADPNLVLAQGLSRALMLEQPSLRFSVVDIGHARHSKQDMQPVCENLLRTLVPLYDMDDKEFIYTEGLLYISRFGPDTALNSQFRHRLGMENRLHQETLGSAGLAQFSVGMVGHPDTIYFQKLREHRTELSSGLVDVAVKAVGLNAKDIYTLGGHLETRRGTEVCEFTGVVREVAKDVTHVQPGDRVMVLWPNHFATIERVPSWAVHKLLPDEEFTIMATIPVVYSTALYALNDRAHLRKGESILVHAGSGALGIALIGLAQSAGAVVFATVGSQAKRDFLMAEFGLPASHIFSSRDSSFVAGVMEMTKGRGVDVLINSLIGDLMHGSWECVANFGRFVEVGKRELLDAGRLDMQGFLRNATFTAFDLEDMVFSDDPFLRDIVSSKVKEALKWYRSRHIKLPPVTTFDIADISQAYRYFSTKDRVGKVALSLENPESKIQVCEPKYSTLFDPEKSYLLVGCLGGLGRSLSRWMLSRGARNFVFLGRSGCDNPDAQKLVSGLRNAGASVVVVKGDVTIASDVTAAVKACTVTGRRIGGIVQGTMALREAIFSQMTNEAWHIGVDCKWAGTWNLHHALEGHDGSLNFFLMTSSSSGSVGVATEANYCASNCFLDSFARWRRSQGKTAVSVGIGMISEVGYLHENPDIQAILIRRGVQGLSEDEFLQLIDFAISGQHNNSDVQEIDDLAAAHILSGMESAGFRKLLAQGFDVSNLPMRDPRSRMLAESLALELRALAARGEVGKMGKFADGTSKAALESDAKAMIAMTSASSRREAILQLVRKQFSNLILVPAEQIDDHKPMAQFGVDSMLAAEFRTWFWTTFEVDISFLDLLSERKSLDSIASVVEAKFAESANSNAGSK